jgi:hypothetical protein
MGFDMVHEKSDKLIWWLMISFFSIIVLGGGAWATNINSKVEKIAGMEVNIQNIKDDVSDIKTLIKYYIKRGE